MITSNFLTALASVINIALTLYMYIIVGRAIISWVNPDPHNPIVRFLHNATEPVLKPIRKKLPYMGGFDLSPIIVLLAIIFLQTFLVGVLREMAIRLAVTPAY